MKPVLYVAMRGLYGIIDLPDLAQDRLIFVTSEAQMMYGEIAYGETALGEAAQCRTDQIVARFSDLDTARKALYRATVAHEAYRVIIERAKEELENLRATQRLAVKTAIRDLAIP